MKSRFMSDKIMPLSQAVEGYELFDNMKVQKGISTIGMIPCKRADKMQWCSKHKSNSESHSIHSREIVKRCKILVV